VWDRRHCVEYLVRLVSWGRRVLHPSEASGVVLLASPAEGQRTEGLGE